MKLLLPFLWFFVCATTRAQDNIPLTDSSTSAAATAVAHYYKFTDQRSRLYNGKEFTGYPRGLIGHPYFIDDQYHKGSVTYDEVFFDDVNMQYDLVKDELLVQHFDVFFKLILIPQKVEDFHLQGHHYKRLVKDTLNKMPLATGYYDFLHEGELKLIVKRTKRIEETITNEVIQKVTEKNFYYILKDGTYHSIRSFKGLLSLLKGKSKDIRQDLRKKHLRFRRQREATILSAVTFYDSSNN